jgi:fatty acid desaturase
MNNCPLCRKRLNVLPPINGIAQQQNTITIPQINRSAHPVNGRQSIPTTEGSRLRIRGTQQQQQQRQQNTTNTSIEDQICENIYYWRYLIIFLLVVIICIVIGSIIGFIYIVYFWACLLVTAGKVY